MKSIAKFLSIALMLALIFSITAFSVSADALPGDHNGDGKVTFNDAAYLLYHTLFGEDNYPISLEADYDGDGVVTDADAVYLMYHTLAPDDYPLDKEQNFEPWIPII